jgi:hypothetical protein
MSVKREGCQSIKTFVMLFSTSTSREWHFKMTTYGGPIEHSLIIKGSLELDNLDTSIFFKKIFFNRYLPRLLILELPTWEDFFLF